MRIAAARAAGLQIGLARVLSFAYDCGRDGTLRSTTRAAGRADVQGD
jgi:hypothetical protein